MNRTVEEIKRPAYFIAAVLGTMSMVLELIFGSPNQSLSPSIVVYDWLTFPLLIGMLGWGAWAIHKGRLTIRTIERWMTLLITGYFIVKFALMLFARPDPASTEAVESWFWWMLTLCVLGFLVFDFRSGVILTVSVWSLALVLHVASVFLKAPTSVAYSLLPQMLASHLRFATVACIISVFGYTKEQWLRFEREAVAMNRLAHIDSLTQVPNRRRLNLSLLNEMDLGEGALTVILFDIDSFKAINDTYGHLVGDEVLRVTAELIQRDLRARDVFGRWGGEEFMIICPDTTLEDGVKLAERLRRMIAHHPFDHGAKVTASFGVAQYIGQDGGGESVEQLLARADRALYEAKTRGRNRVEKAPFHQASVTG